jgi:hypothetical protein
MRTIISRWFLFGLLLGWALTHATVFGQSTSKTDPPVNNLRVALDKPITVDFSGPTMESVLKHICDKAGLPFEYDPTIVMQMQIGFNRIGGDPQAQSQVKATDEKASQVLRRFLKAYHLTCVQSEGTILITTEELAVHRQYRQRVSIDVVDVPLKKAVRELAKNHGINLVIDPKVATEADAPVTLQLDDTGLETALRLLAEMANLKAVRMGNVMFVTNEEKAKKIRKEERQQDDNPNNPPYFTPPMMGVGIAMPGRAVPAVPAQVLPAIPAGPPPGVEAPPVPQRDPQPVKNPANKAAPTPGTPPLPPAPPMVQPPAINGAPAPTTIPRVIRN